MRRPTILSVALAIALPLPPAAAQRPPREQTAARLDALARAFVASGATPGLAVYVLRGDDPLLLRGYGYANLEDSAPVTPRTVFRIGSLTKQFTAAAVMRLVQEGRIALNDTIQRFLPTFPTRGHRATIRQLLAHTSGIRSWTSIEGWDSNRHAPQDSVVALIASQPFDFPPGQRWQYSNSGYYLLGVILERVTGRPYDQVVRDMLAAPFGLADTRYCFIEPVIPRRAAGYRVEGGAFVNARLNAMTQPFAAGALCSTAPDLVAWTRALFAGRVVRRELVDSMTTPARLSDGSATQYGFGLRIGAFEGHRRMAHGGGINGFTSALAYFPDDSLIVAVLSNANTDLTALLDSLVRTALGLGR